MKSPSKEIANILRSRNNHKKYIRIIERAENNGYHDFKFDRIPDHPEYGECSCPKMQLVMDLKKFPELNDITQRIIDGDFDDSADEDDKSMMRSWLIEDGSPDKMYDILGLGQPTPAEIGKYRKDNKN